MSDLLKKLALALVISSAALMMGVMVATKEKKQPTVSLSVDAAVSGNLIPEQAAKAVSSAIQAVAVAEPGKQALTATEQAQISDFATWAGRVLNSLPQVTKLSENEDPHENVEGHSEALREGAADVAELYDYVAKNPVTTSVAVNAFKNCALDNLILDPIRAYCYSKAVRLGLELGQEFWDPSDISDQIKNLSRDL